MRDDRRKSSMEVRCVVFTCTPSEYLQRRACVNEQTSARSWHRVYKARPHSFFLLSHHNLIFSTRSSKYESWNFMFVFSGLQNSTTLRLMSRLLFSTEYIYTQQNRKDYDLCCVWLLDQLHTYLNILFSCQNRFWLCGSQNGSTELLCLFSRASQNRLRNPQCLVCFLWPPKSET